MIYEKPQSICDINFENECQNDVVLGSFRVSRCNVLRGTGSEACFCPAGETRKSGLSQGDCDKCARRVSVDCC